MSFAARAFCFVLLSSLGTCSRDRGSRATPRAQQQNVHVDGGHQVVIGFELSVVGAEKPSAVGEVVYNYYS